jgi:DNA-binding transcriptional MocR family regulator
MTVERRRQLVDLVRQREVVLVEDSPYEELRYEGEALPGLLELDRPPDDGGRVIRAGTFSKTLMPGLRVGWAIGPRPVIRQMATAKQAVDLHTSTFNQFIVLELLRSGYEEQCLPALRQAYRERRDAMLGALQRGFPAGVRWTRPAGGMFIWVTLPPGISAMALLPRAMEHGVAFVPGGEFHVDGGGQDTLRLNFSHSSVAAITAGMEKLADVLG